MARDVKVSCSDHKVHYVSASGFVLLELVEGALGSLEQKIVSVVLWDIKGLLSSSLKSRMVRQEEMIKEVFAQCYICKTQEDAEALPTLVQRSERFNLQRVAIKGEIGVAGWAALPEALQLLPPYFLGGGAFYLSGFQALVAERNLMLDGRREDVKAVLDALPGESHVFMTKVKTQRVMLFKKEDWVRMEKYLDDEDSLVAENEIEANNNILQN